MRARTRFLRWLGMFVFSNHEPAPTCWTSWMRDETHQLRGHPSSPRARTAGGRSCEVRPELPAKRTDLEDDAGTRGSSSVRRRHGRDGLLAVAADLAGAAAAEVGPDEAARPQA